MSSMNIDGPVLEKLRGISSGTSLCDPAGKSIGVVVSEEDYLKLLYAQAMERYTDDEIEEMRRRPHVGKTTEELLEAMKSEWTTK